jgi:RimJ/RimL family protein N-acetyltransferase
MVVRIATAEDVPALSRIIATVAEEGFLGAEPPVDLAARGQRLLEIINAPGLAAVWALDDEDIRIGFASAHERVPGVLSLGMALLPGGRGRGGGRSLLDAITAHAISGGAHKLDLEAWSDNARAIAFYASAGFEVEGVRRDHYRRRDGRLRSTLIMARPLRPLRSPR